MTIKVEVHRFFNGDLKLLVKAREGSNIWIIDEREIDWTPKISEVKLIKDALTAIDEFNVYKRSFKSKNGS
jgi:hypothetical protein